MKQILVFSLADPDDTSTMLNGPGPTTPAALTKRIISHLRSHGSRTVLHVDLDAFYAQVEMVRCGIPAEQPLCVQQWQGLIAVNYPARAKGIKRHCTVTDALALCPELKLVHVATYVAGSHVPDYYPNPTYQTHKVSLKPYRDASGKIFGIIERFVPPSQGTVERASIDEAYAELTEIINKRIAARFASFDVEDEAAAERAVANWEALENEEEGPEVTWNRNTYVVGLPEPDADAGSQDEEPRRTRGWHDLQLHEAATLVSEIRETIRTELGYTCSAGIGSNKMLAKLVSALNKPDKQTALRHASVLDFMRDLPFTKIRNLGGKFGEKVEAVYGAKSVSDLWKHSREELQAKFGPENGSWLFDAVRGINTDEVVKRTKSQTLLSAKSFRPPLTNIGEIQHWLSVFGWEIYERISEDFEANGRWAKNMVMHIKSSSLDKSRSCAFPPRHMCDGDAIAARALEMIKSEGEAKCFPLFHCSLQAGGLFGDKGSGNIEKFFGKKVEGEEPTRDERAGSDEETMAEVDGEEEQTGLPPAEPTFTCSKCSKAIPESQQAEHEDYHFALDLSKESRVLLGGSGSGSGGSAGTKRKAPAAAKKGGEKKLTSFFTKQ